MEELKIFLIFWGVLLTFHRSKESGMSKVKEVEKLQEDFNKFEKNINDLTQDRMNKAPEVQHEPQTKLSNKELENSKDIWLKPDRTIPDGQKFNPRLEEKWKFQKEYVQFIAEHKELIGETLEFWTHPFGGKGAEFWKVPTNKPVWAPRYVAEQIRSCKYHRLRMDEGVTHSHGMGKFYGSMVVDTTIPRLTAEPVNTGKSIFMGAAA